MEEWWKKTDCALTPPMITSLLAEQAPALDCGSARYFSEGWDSWVYTAVARDGASWILRFPKRAGVAKRLEREIVLLPIVGPRLRLSVPSFGLLGMPGAGYPHKFVGYRRLPGRPAIEADLAPLDGAALGVVLGSFLGTLHDCPIEVARRCGVEVAEVETADDTAQHISAAKVQLATYGHTLDIVPRRCRLRSAACSTMTSFRSTCSSRTQVWSASSTGAMWRLAIRRAIWPDSTPLWGCRVLRPDLRRTSRCARRSRTPRRSPDWRSAPASSRCVARLKIWNTEPAAAAIPTSTAGCERCVISTIPELIPRACFRMTALPLILAA
jgi:hypothetical protein